MDQQAGWDPRTLEGRSTQGHGSGVAMAPGLLGLTWDSRAQGTDKTECLLVPEWVWLGCQSRHFGVGVLGRV